MSKSNEKLFSEFPPVSTEQWMEKIVADLKGADFEKKLVWKTNEGFDVKPFYRAEDVATHGGRGRMKKRRGSNHIPGLRRRSFRSRT